MALPSVQYPLASWYCVVSEAFFYEVVGRQGDPKNATHLDGLKLNMNDY